jgi:hypothetical protein
MGPHHCPDCIAREIARSRAPSVSDYGRAIIDNTPEDRTIAALR